MIGRGMLVTVLALVTSSLAAEAQPPGPVRTIGIIGHTKPSSFEDGLRELGWVEGKNVRFEQRFSTDNQRLAQFAAELSQIPVDVIFAANAASTRAAMKATRASPIITVSADPVSTGFVTSLARPETNVTGLSIMHTELSGKRLEILTQALPRARRIALLVNPGNPSTPAVRQETEARARALGVKLLLIEANSSERVAEAVAAVVKKDPDALIVQGDPLFFLTRQDLLEAAAHHRLPAMWEHKPFVEAGGLMSYGVHPGELYRRAAAYADRILKGAKPSNLPVEQATMFELAINLKTAKTLGITIPKPVLLRADHVVQ